MLKLYTFCFCYKKLGIDRNLYMYVKSESDHFARQISVDPMRY